MSCGRRSGSAVASARNPWQIRFPGGPSHSPSEIGADDVRQHERATGRYNESATWVEPGSIVVNADRRGGYSWVLPGHRRRRAG